MTKMLIFTALAALFAGKVAGQATKDSLPVYNIQPSADITILSAGAAWDLYGFSQVSDKNGTSQAELANLKTGNIDWWDRWAVHPYSHSIDQLSYIPFFVAMPLPLAFFGIDSRMRKDFWKLTMLYAESMTLTGVLYTSAVHYVNRHRPLVYEDTSPMDVRMSSNSRNSFFAGHVALVGTSVFFIARTYADYHPESKIKWVFYGGAAAITGLTGYWRNRAGEHFPTDIALGSVIGVASGLLTPALHKTKIGKAGRLSLSPAPGQSIPTGSRGHAVALVYRFP